jgi:hypothetical protein
MQVEIDIYSGRPNPVLRLTQAQAAEFMARLGRLAEAPEQGASQDLGYRGLIVSADGLDGVSRVELRAGVARVERTDGSSRSYLDGGRALELWTVEQSRAGLPSDLVGAVMDAISRERSGR